jgi:hypothetical protein
LDRYVVSLVEEVMRSLSGFALSARDPEHTGENRCLPCTVANTAIAAALAAVVGAGTTPLVGAITFVCCVGVIYLRGYLVPGTPTLTKRYLPEPVLRLFRKDTARGRSLDYTISDGSWQGIVGNVITSTEPPQLADDFRRRWRRELAASRDSPTSGDDVAEVVGKQVTEKGPLSFAVDGERLLRWESDVALDADAAAAPVLRDRIDDWADANTDTRLVVLRRIRLATERCPGCNGVVDRRVERNETCCRRPRVRVWTECRGCNALLAEVVLSESDADRWIGDEEGERVPRKSGRWSGQ